MAALALTPSQAALIAANVYNIRAKNVAEAKKNPGIGVTGKDFQVSGNDRFLGRTGANFTQPITGDFLSKSTGFGYIGEGVNSFRNHTLIAIRGTYFPNGVDVLTDLKVGLSVSCCGNFVHAGFNDTFRTFKQCLDDYFRKHNPEAVHVVGHSLGGGLAHLTANYVNKLTSTPTKLYTFGSPRVGVPGFSLDITRSLGAENIYRVHHNNDPVSLVPYFPYAHAPMRRLFDPDPGYFIRRGTKYFGEFFTFGAHFMEAYAKTVQNHSWSSLQTESRFDYNNDEIDRFLSSAASSGSGIKLMSAAAFWMIGKALFWILDKIETVLGVAVYSVTTAAGTIIDKLAWLLHQGALMSIKIAGYVKNLITAIFKFLGRSAQTSGNLTLAFIRYVLDLFTNVLKPVVSRAVNNSGQSTSTIASSDKVSEEVPFVPKQNIS